VIKRVKTSPLLSKISICNNTAYFSGLIQAERAGIDAQTVDLLFLLDSFLKEAGTNRSKLAHLLIHLRNMDDYDKFNSIYLEWIEPNSAPSRTCVQAELPNPSALVEITAVAEL